jgi:palmitoyltransferase ZDHHC9/14/18
MATGSTDVSGAEGPDQVGRSATTRSPTPNGTSSNPTVALTEEPGRQGANGMISPSQNPYRRSLQNTHDAHPSRPETGKSVMSTASRSPWSPASSPGMSQVIPTRQVGQSGSSPIGRPQSSASRSHVPSLTSHAFFRPMSSQRLQAQRAGSRAATPGQAGISDEEPAERSNSTARHSYQSTQTPRPRLTSSEVHEPEPPPSRGTEMTEPETSGRLTSNTSPTHGHYGAGSLSESVRPLQHSAYTVKDLSVNVDSSHQNGGDLNPTSRSPRSFRPGFLPSSRAAEGDLGSPNRGNQGREKLSFASSSAAMPSAPATTKEHGAPRGKNYEYFTGNTRFFWGGRLQNTRDRPVNIATGLFVLIPGILFFIFSAPWLWSNISPAIPLIFAYAFYLCVSSFVHASVSDPGVSRNFPPSVIILFLIRMTDIASKPSSTAGRR